MFRLKNLQAVRLYAALSVVLVHLLPLYGHSAPFGHSGVDVFFVLSGFLMAMISESDPGAFLRRRLIRIIPAYWLCTLGIFVIALACPRLLHTTGANAWNLLKSLCFVPYRKESGLIQPMLNLGWTLNYELFFYGIFALILWLKLPRPGLIVALIVSAFAATGLLLQPQSDLLQFYTSPIVMDFVLGIAAFQFFASFRNGMDGVWSLTLLLGLVLALPFLEICGGLGRRIFFMGAPAAAILVLAAQLDSRNFSVNQRWVLLAGDASYLLYLTHLYVFQLGEKLIPIKPGWSLVARAGLGVSLVALALLVAITLHLWFELPLLEYLKSRLLPENAGKRQPFPAPAADAPATSLNCTSLNSQTKA